MSKPRWVYALMGLGIILYGLFTYSSTDKLIENGAYAQGVIIDKSKSSYYGEKSYNKSTNLTIKFSAGDHKAYEFTTFRDKDFDKYQVNDVVKVIYNPNSPSQAVLNDPVINAKRTLMLLVIGIAFIAIAIWGNDSNFLSSKD